MEKKGLLEEPRFDEPGYYLTSGPRTEVTESLWALAQKAQGNTDEELAMNMIDVMNDEVDFSRLVPEGEFGKYQKTAEYILKEKMRTSVVDSATLYTALLRARGIPAMQIMTMCVPDAVRDPELFWYGYMYVAAFLRDEEGKGKWKFVDPNIGKMKHSWSHFYDFDPEDRNFENAEYAFAYTRDYGELDYMGRKFTSERMYRELQRLFFRKCNKYDMAYIQKLLKEQEERKKKEAEEKRKKEEETEQKRRQRDSREDR